MKILIYILAAALILPGLAFAAASVSISQSGADSNSVMQGRVFTVSVAGATANAQAIITSYPAGFSLTGESFTKTASSSGSVSWTTTVISQKLSGQTISVSISGQGSPETATSSTFNVITAPSISATVSPGSASAAQGSNLALSLNIVNSGETSARFGTITVSPSIFSVSSGCSPSEISGGQSAGISCSIAVSPSASTGAQTLTVIIAPSNADSITKTVSVTVTAASSETPGTGTTGGGGGGGGGANTYDKGEILRSVTQSLAKGDVVKFNLKGQAHQLKLANLTNTTATFNLSSSWEVFSLRIGQEKRKDFDGDGSFDLAVFLKTIANSKAEVTITPFAGTVPVSATAPAEAPKETESSVPQEPSGILPGEQPQTKETGKGEQQLSAGFVLVAVLVILITAAIAYVAWDNSRKRKGKEKQE
ncbi:MAG: hypothetical protein HYX24_02605 [Candidatus Aenigmarchaeota archaeon]|nr:hypothetical protein [Candidatus Aenigmarchaeota archaeon]